MGRSTLLLVGSGVLADTLAKHLATPEVEVVRTPREGMFDVLQPVAAQLVVLVGDAASERGAPLIRETLQRFGSEAPRIVVVTAPQVGMLSPQVMPAGAALLTPEGGMVECARRLRALLDRLQSGEPSPSSLQELTDATSRKAASATQKVTPAAPVQMPSGITARAKSPPTAAGVAKPKATSSIGAVVAKAGAPEPAPAVEMVWGETTPTVVAKSKPRPSSSNLGLQPPAAEVPRSATKQGEPAAKGAVQPADERRATAGATPPTGVAKPGFAQPKNVSVPVGAPDLARPESAQAQNASAAGKAPAIATRGIVQTKDLSVPLQTATAAKNVSAPVQVPGAAKRGSAESQALDSRLKAPAASEPRPASARDVSVLVQAPAAAMPGVSQSKDVSVPAQAPAAAMPGVSQSKDVSVPVQAPAAAMPGVSQAKSVDAPVEATRAAKLGSAPDVRVPAQALGPAQPRAARSKDVSSPLQAAGAAKPRAASQDIDLLLEAAAAAEPRPAQAARVAAPRPVRAADATVPVQAPSAAEPGTARAKDVTGPVHAPGAAEPRTVRSKDISVPLQPAGGAPPGSPSASDASLPASDASSRARPKQQTLHGHAPVSIAALAAGGAVGVQVRIGSTQSMKRVTPSAAQAAAEEPPSGAHSEELQPNASLAPGAAPAAEARNHAEPQPPAQPAGSKQSTSKFHATVSRQSGTAFPAAASTPSTGAGSPASKQSTGAFEKVGTKQSAHDFAPEFDESYGALEAVTSSPPEFMQEVGSNRVSMSTSLGADEPELVVSMQPAMALEPESIEIAAASIEPPIVSFSTSPSRDNLEPPTPIAISIPATDEVSLRPVASGSRRSAARYVWTAVFVVVLGAGAALAMRMLQPGARQERTVAAFGTLDHAAAFAQAKPQPSAAVALAKPTVPEPSKDVAPALANDLAAAATETTRGADVTAMAEGAQPATNEAPREASNEAAQQASNGIAQPSTASAEPGATPAGPEHDANDPIERATAEAAATAPSTGVGSQPVPSNAVDAAGLATVTRSTGAGPQPIPSNAADAAGVATVTRSAGAGPQPIPSNTADAAGVAAVTPSSEAGSRPAPSQAGIAALAAGHVATDSNTDDNSPEPDSADSDDGATTPPPGLLRAEGLADEGLGWFKQGRFGLAEAAYLRALRSFPSYPRALAGLVRVHIARQDGAEAVRWAKRLTKRQSSRAQNHLLLGDAQALRGDTKAARKAWTRAMRLGSLTARSRLRNAKT